VTTPAIASPGVAVSRPRGRLARMGGVLRQVLSHRSGALGIAILVFFTFVALFPDLLVGPLQTAVTADGPSMAPPQPGYPSGRTSSVGASSTPRSTVPGSR